MINENKPIINSGASVTMFKNTRETVSGSYQEGSEDTIQLAVGFLEIGYLGYGTVNLGEAAL